MSSVSDDIHLLAGSYAVNALNDIDRRRFEAHLATCESCPEELAGFSVAVDHLVEQAAEPAPDHLKRSVMAQVDQTRQSSVLAPAPRSVLRHVPKVAASVAAIAAVAVGYLFVQADARADRLGEIASVYQAEDSQTVILASDRGPLTLAFSQRSRTAVLDADTLADLDDDLVYQLWIIGVDGPLPETTFTAADVKNSLIFSLENEVDPGAVIAVTVEPEGGSGAPSSPPFVVSEPV